MSKGSTHPFTCGEVLPLLGCARSTEHLLLISCQMTKWLTSILEDSEHPPSFHLKLRGSFHLCSMKPLLPRPCVTLELEEEREAVCRRSFCKRNCNAEKARCWPEGDKRWCCRKTGGLEQAQCGIFRALTYSRWCIQAQLSKMWPIRHCQHMTTWTDEIKPLLRGNQKNLGRLLSFYYLIYETGTLQFRCLCNLLRVLWIERF